MAVYYPKHLAEKEEIENQIFKHNIFLWEPFYTKTDSLSIRGPLCSRCFIHLNPRTDHTIQEVTCTGCNKTYKTEETFEQLRGEAHSIFEGYLRSRKKVITLDIPISNVFDKIKDDHHVVKAYLSQKDGKKMALVYILERDADGDKSQIFLDLENEQVRYDPSDIPPSKLLAKMKVEFKNSSVSIDYKPE